MNAFLAPLLCAGRVNFLLHVHTADKDERRVFERKRNVTLVSPVAGLLRLLLFQLDKHEKCIKIKLALAFSC